ncbi:MAG: hypothetical protein HYV07_17865 [Deltaproteobacteria bacterium]|nr:hypothetical protein [Deltaproteobacteria bacterium]
MSHPPARSVLVASLLASCSADSLAVALDLVPPDVTRLAVLFEASGGAAVAATGLIDFNGHHEIEMPSVTDDASDVFVLGWSEESLADVSIPPEPERVRLPVRRSTGVATELPLPSWAGHGALGETVELERTAGFAVEAPWPLMCADFLPGAELRVDSSCAGTYCGGAIEQHGCEISVSLGVCVPSVLAGRRGASGAVTFETEGGACTAEDSPSAWQSLRCPSNFVDGQSCEIDLYAFPAPPRLRSRSAPLGRPGQRSRLVSAFGELLSVSIDGCQSTASIHAIDPETLEVTRTSTAPRCLRAVTAVNGGLVGVGRSRDTEGWSLFGLDASARVLSELPIGGATSVTPETMVAIDADRVVALFETRLVAIDLSARRVVLDRPGDFLVDLAATNEGFVVLEIPPDEAVARYAADGELLERLTISAACGPGSKVPRWIYHDPTTGRDVISSGGGNARLYSLADARDCRRIGFFEQRLEPGPIIGWPSDPSLALSSLYSLDAASAALVNLENGYLPGAIELGPAPVTSFVVHEQHVFGTLASTATEPGRIVRIDPL